jgi:hypothetical protein
MMLDKQQGTEAPARCINETCRSIFVGSQMSSESRNAIKSPRAAAMPRLRAAAGPADYTDSFTISLQSRQRIVLGAVIHDDYLNVRIGLR